MRPEFEIIVGDSFELSLDQGQLRADHVSTSGVTVQQIVAPVNGKATIATPDLGRHYLAIREHATARWRRIGTLEVVALVDADRERLEKELADLNQRVSELEAIQYQVSDPAGVSVTRVNLNQLRVARSRAETRLADYIRAKQGQPPARMS